MKKRTTSFMQLPYVEARYKGGKQNPTAIVLLPSFTTSERGSALGIANHWHSPSSPHHTGHYVVDEAEAYETTRPRTKAGHWHCSQKNLVRIVLCAEPINGEVFWNNKVHAQVLAQAAKVVASLMLEHDIRDRYLNDEEQRAWFKRPWRRRGGLIVDTPSGWPYESFINEVKAQKALQTPI